MKTVVYIDAFNLYYGCLKDTPHKWLDLQKFCQMSLPQNQVTHIRYFTAKVVARPHDLQQPVRQQTYFRALGTLPNLTIHYGHYLETKVRMRLVTPLPDGT